MWQTICGLAFASFIAIKVGGVALAAWSWWWLLMPLVPCLALIFTHFNLL